MLHFCKLFPLLLVIIASGVGPCRAVRHFGVPNLDSLCYISTDTVEVSLVRHSGVRDFANDTFTATVINTLGGDYKCGDKIELPYNQVILPPQHSCSHCILFISRKDFQLDLENAMTIPPQVNEVLPIDEFDRVQRYFQWINQQNTVTSKGGDAAEQSYPKLADERQIIISRWAVVNQMRPLLSHALCQEDVVILLKLNRQRLHLRKATLGLDDVIDELIQARLTDLHNPASQQSAKLASAIRFAGAIQHVICGH